MKFVVDMNLSPQWVDYFNDRGHDAIHWSSIGSAEALDSEIMEWARDHHRVVLTSDLDFGTILALTGSSKPSVVQLRSDATLPVHVGSVVIEAVEQAKSDLLSGALLTVDMAQPRLRILPFDPER